MSHRNRGRRSSAAVLAGLIASTSIAARAQTAPSPTKAISPAAQISIGAADIGGVVATAHGPEAGVWVIAETTDLPTKFAKIVVTDDAGRYLIPDLPKANYKVWVRGYGLVDSPRVDVTLGQNLDLAATIAPSEAAAAKYYPGVYWYSMLHIPAVDQFPGTGETGNGIPPFLKTQGAWIDTIKNSCQSCHALGSGTVQRSGGSSRLRQLWAWRGDWIEHTTEPGAEHAVVDRAADLKKQIGASPRPSHLLRFIHSPVDQEIRGTFGN